MEVFEFTDPIKCDECWQLSRVFVSVGERIGYEPRGCNLCPQCIAKAAAMTLEWLANHTDQSQ